VRRFRVVVPDQATTAAGQRPQPVWRVGSVLKFCLDLSRIERSQIWRHGGVTVNGRPAQARHTHCLAGDVVEAWYAEAASRVRPEPEIPLQVLFEDEWLLAVDKPAGQLAHPARSEVRGTVANAVAARYRLKGDTAPAPVRLVHRLDRDTSGVLLFARDASTARVLARQRAAGTLVRDYLALVAGRPPVAGEIELPLGADPAHRTRRRVSPGSAASPGAMEAAEQSEERDTGVTAGLAARTSYRVIQYGQAATLIAARLHTGRTHQLRVHLASARHPLLADDLYDGPSWPGIRRQALHAWRTRLRHPASGAWFAITAPVPADFRAAAHHALRA
jgi:23S rRNA pseudouridine1911/1915/1917 synthase